MKRDDIRLKSREEKEKVYEQIHAYYLSGKSARIKEDRSGFPAVTVDCEDIHIVTDIISLEQWWADRKEGERLSKAKSDR